MVSLVLADSEVKKVKTRMMQKLRIKMSEFTRKNSVSFFTLKIRLFCTSDRRPRYFFRKRKTARANPMYCDRAVPKATPSDFMFNPKTNKTLSRILATLAEMATIIGYR